MERILPQANSFDTIVKVFMFAGMKTDYTKADIAQFCQFDIRQSDYYLSACIYFGLFDKHGQLTEVGKDIIQNDIVHCKERLYERVILDELTGKVFAHMLLFQKDKSEAKAFAKNLVDQIYPQYSDAVNIRRSSCIVGWCEEILDYLSNKR